MSEIATVIALTGVGFAATNLDNLVLLITWLVMPATRPLEVLGGLVLGMAGLIGLCYGVALSAEFFPVQFLGLLGVVPLVMGTRHLVRWWRRGADGQHNGPGGAAVLTVAGVQLANGTDTVVVFAPLLADTRGELDLWVVATFLSSVLVWFGLALALARRARALGALDRYADLLAAVVMIAIGLYILDNTATDLVAGA
jgi:cadmium resistance protein CadD (predicted permease)